MEDSNTEELLEFINSIIDDNLGAEVILTAIREIKADPELTIYEALYSGQLTWDV